ncbi:hypothetical protein Tsubulata_041006 [Turnera subulata]|uniref:Uncharacterized protein n=1 Tax=Turnera subulata TaxID=218843 RepID=A0A9Q0JNV9_9ROSI|nr:hypothetical protein Tsubulata_041006 [Turnera subulata]
MASTKMIHACISLLLILTLQLHSIEARNLKRESENEFPKLQTTGFLENKTRKLLQENSHLHVHDNSDKPVTNVSPPTPPAPAVGQPAPPPGHRVDDFRPTAPGHSPGVGHSLQG